jgi:hypothetical protein
MLAKMLSEVKLFRGPKVDGWMSAKSGAAVFPQRNPSPQAKLPLLPDLGSARSAVGSNRAQPIYQDKLTLTRCARGCKKCRPHCSEKQIGCSSDERDEIEAFGKDVKNVFKKRHN